MANNQYYWEGKKKRADIAAKHTADMQFKFPSEIAECIKKTRCYSGQLEPAENTFNEGAMKAEIFKGDSVSAIMSLCEKGKRTAVLNFASYKYAGGGFMAGSRAQEEALCHESFLYNVLREFEMTYYVPNRKNLNKALYQSRALYSPNVAFIRNGKVQECDVLTCAAPNFSAAKKNYVSRDVNNECMRERIRFILEIAKREKVDTFIVGAWGCGVFEQDPKIVAKYFIEEGKSVLSSTKMKLVFAVIPPLPNQTDNLTPFVQAVNNFEQ